MQVTIFVERLDEQTYHAETAHPVMFVTEGRTRDEAIERVRVLAQQRLTAGEMVRLKSLFCAATLAARLRRRPPLACGTCRAPSAPQ